MFPWMNCRLHSQRPSTFNLHDRGETGIHLERKRFSKKSIEYVHWVLFLHWTANRSGTPGMQMQQKNGVVTMW